MATLPRYQQMGIQYADLPRVSTAGIEAGARATDALGQSLDRMIDFAFQRATTTAEKKAKEYAIQNPLTKQQVDDALATGQGTKVPGAGRIFQTTYDRVQANLLSTELKLEANKAFAAVSATIESGQPFDMGVIQNEIKDMIDGYSATIMALDPDEGLRFKAATTSAGNSLYQTAAKRAEKNFRAYNVAMYDQAMIDVKPVLQSIFENAGSVDPETGKPIDVESLLEIQRQPFLDSVPLFGDAKYLTAFNKEVQEMKVNALVSRMTDREMFDTSSQALSDMNRNDFGELSGLYAGLPKDEQQKVIDNVMRSFGNDYTAFIQGKARDDYNKKQEWSAMSIQLLNPNVTDQQKRALVEGGVRLNQITVQQAESLLRPSAGQADPVLFVSLNDMIQRGQIENIADLLDYRERLSDQEYKTLGTAVTSTQGRMAVANMNRFIGIRENQFVAEDKDAKAKIIMEFYVEELGVQVRGDDGVAVTQSPTQAMNAAIKRFGADKSIQSSLAAQESIRRRVDGLFAASRAANPGLPVEQLDPSMIRGLSATERSDLQKFIKDYKESLNSITGR